MSNLQTSVKCQTVQADTVYIIGLLNNWNLHSKHFVSYKLKFSKQHIKALLSDGNCIFNRWYPKHIRMCRGQISNNIANINYLATNK